MTSAATETAFLHAVHERLAAWYDIDRWHWRDETPALDICLGAILVQHTNWSNVEKALAHLRAFLTAQPEALEGPALSALEVIADLPEAELAAIIRPAGTPMTKARRLQAFADLARKHGGLNELLSIPPAELRVRLLATPGIGPETADVILLYAARAPVTVHDAYTQRLFRRLGLGPESGRYDRWQAWLDARLPVETAYRRAHHAAIVIHCKETCRARPRCDACVLRDLCSFPA
jgi:endonuclease-3 related protein